MHGIDAEAFEIPAKRAFAANAGAAELARLHRDLLAIFEAEAGQPWPEDPAVQLEAAARAMARRWNAPSARLLRAARGAPEAAGLGLVVQELALALGPGASGAGYLQLVDSRTGAGAESGGFRPQRQRGEAGTAGQGGLDALPAKDARRLVGGGSAGDRRPRRRGAH